MRQALQTILIFLAIIPLGFGALNLFVGAERFLPVENITAAIDSQLRFQSAWYLALAAIILWMVPRIERKTTLFRIIILSLFVGGIARAWSWFMLGSPPVGMQFGMYLELALPLLLPLQARVARETKAARH
ncbi:hypothetical protein GCM10007385_45350 [Tateyamaria omphalii]|uniref:DUF4345 domain-containing protein n=1 Tax=Tateyamaria omphalii TaxID=299262 RepID=UPI00167418E1|nr:DUF4345 domain-containing protein [Tateyamaria omphalii]GGX71274.1 hypothetical protein GCM10007385_45350 [Tateyamaria omphalii]